MTVQDSLELVDLALIDRALRQHDDIDAVGLVPSSGQHAIQQFKVEPFGWDELEESERLALQPLQRSLHGAEVGLADPQRPRQQHEMDELRLWVGAGMAGGQLVPPGF